MWIAGEWRFLVGSSLPETNKIYFYWDTNPLPAVLAGRDLATRVGYPGGPGFSYLFGTRYPRTFVVLLSAFRHVLTTPQVWLRRHPYQIIIH